MRRVAPIVLEIPVPPNRTTDVEIARVELEEVCGECKGECMVYTAEFAAWLDRYGYGDLSRALSDEAEAAMPMRDLEPCGVCAGTGVVATEDGRRLLEFIGRPKGWV